MEFQTKIPIEEQRHDRIDHHSKLLLLGSCFVESIGEKLNYFKFQTLNNPFGILFHPLAIENFIVKAINDYQYTSKDLVVHNGIYQSFDAHSKLSATSEEQSLSNLNDQIQLTKDRLVNISHLVITLGTAWTYRHISSDKTVANCHKIPQKQFTKELLSIPAISESLDAIIGLVRSVNPKCAFLFTVSPVRHLKDGFIENNQSKAHLISALHTIIEPRDHIYYFPSYELVMDELRDYRFFAEDMIHPNDLAISYIWEKFTATWMTDETHDVMDVIDEVQKGLDHKPFHPESEQHQLFLNRLKTKQAKISSQFSHIVF
ncbi:MAG: GSCFA domain-containing protein [Bacteroidia bacterium]|nr:GSCFA domain-containing protein [Bacteroidia bacterium]NNK60670.1 GSCFA domain-containing protein [Flavobacteriaceae bacterium]